MKTSLTLRIYSLTCAVFHTYARVLPSSLASADSSTSKSIGRDLDPPSQNLAGSCPASPSINKRGVTLGDGASYDTFTPVELALNTPPPAGDAISVGDNQPSTFTMNPTDNQPIDWNNIFNGQNKVDQLISIPAGNMFLSNIPANPSAPTENIALDNPEMNNPGGNSDAIVNSGWVIAGKFIVPDPLPYNAETGVPQIECEAGPLNAYTVWEMTYQGTSMPAQRWPHAILVAHGFLSQPPFIRYTVVRTSKNELQLGKNNPFSFMQKGKPVLLHEFTRKGWLVAPEGVDKKSVLTWFEGKINVKKILPLRPILPEESKKKYDFKDEPITTKWARYIFDEVLPLSHEKFWVPYPEFSTPSLDPSTP